MRSIDQDGAGLGIKGYKRGYLWAIVRQNPSVEGREDAGGRGNGGAFLPTAREEYDQRGEQTKEGENRSQAIKIQQRKEREDPGGVQINTSSIL